jgi:hypothetical protein
MAKGDCVDVQINYMQAMYDGNLGMGNGYGFMAKDH